MSTIKTIEGNVKMELHMPHLDCYGNDLERLFLEKRKQNGLMRNSYNPLDINDNTGEYHELAAVIGLFNPAWDSTEDTNEAFLKAVDLAQTILELKFKKVFSVERAKTIAEEAIRKQQEGITVIEIGAPWKQFVANTGIEFVVSPSQRGGYNAQAVEIEENEERKLICPFPESWRGKTSEQLQEISGIESLHFAHNSGFLAATKTLDDAILACKLAK